MVNTRIASKATKGKGKHWKKGQSSSSNPTSTKFRSKVVGLIKSVSQANATPRDVNSDLTVEALASHNAFSLQNLSLGGDRDEDGESVISFASAWSKCTNPSFDRFLNGWQSSSALHKEMLAVLGSVTETIKSRGGKETETEYFAVLITSLETVDNENGLAAIVQLLRMVMKRVPQAILRIKFSDVAKILVEHLNSNVHSENGALVRGLIASLASMLRAQDYATWTQSSTQLIFSTLLSFTGHAKPRIRKAAHRAVIGIVKGSSVLTKPGCDYHPSASTVANFCVTRMEETGLKDDISKVLHVISLLKDVLPVLPKQSIKTSCEIMLRFMTLGNVLVLTSCFQAFNNLFTSQPKGLVSEMNVQLILALRDFQPSTGDSQPLAAWLTVTKEALVNLNRLDASLYYRHLQSIIDVNVNCWLSESKQVQEVIALNFKAHLELCAADVNGTRSKAPVTKMWNSLQTCLGYQYNRSWGSVCGVLAITFSLFENAYPELVSSTLKALGDIHERDSIDCGAELEEAIGAAVKHLGPEIVLKAIPITMDFETRGDYAKSWLIRVLRENVERAKLSFFTSYFVPLAALAKSAANRLEQMERAVDAKSLRIYYVQIWSLLPSFCKKPIDVKESFRSLAKTLGAAIQNELDIRHSVLQSLRMLIRTATSSEETEEISKYAKNYIPILLNIYTSESKDSRLEVLDTIESFAVCSENLASSLYLKLKEKFSTATDAFSRLSLLDVLRVFVPHLSQKDQEDALRSVSVQLITESKVHKELKKAYRILEEICKSNSDASRTTVETNLTEILSLLINGLGTCPEPAKSALLKALSAIVNRFGEDAPDDVKQVSLKVLPSVFECLLINSQRTKNAAFELLLSITKALSKATDGLNEFYNFVLVSLKAGTPEIKTSVVVGLSFLLPNLRELLPKDHLRAVILETLNATKSENRALISAIFDFVKILFKELSKDEMLSYVEILVGNITSLSPLNRKHFRTAIKETFIRVSRKYGNDLLLKLVPASFSKVLRNIRKVEGRKARSKKAGDDEESPQTKKFGRDEIDEVLRDSSDDEMDDNEDETRHKQGSAWIEENVDGDDVLDLLSNKASRKILSTNPFKRKLQQAKEQTVFSTAADGRIIISDEVADDEEPEEEEVVEARVPAVKRSQAEYAEDDDDEIQEPRDDDDAPVGKYRHGGRGIHRVPIKRNQKSANAPDVKTGKEYRSKKARGDMKKKGLPDPYAYVPLQRQSLNKRKAAKYAGQFKNIISAAKRGASLGTKSKQTKK